MNTVNSIYDKLMAWAWFESFVAMVLNLDNIQLWAIILLAAVLFTYMAHKKAGVGAVVALLLIYMFAYILFQFDLINFYEEKVTTNEKHNKTIEEELKK